MQSELRRYHDHADREGRGAQPHDTAVTMPTTDAVGAGFAGPVPPYPSRVDVDTRAGVGANPAATALPMVASRIPATTLHMLRRSRPAHPHALHGELGTPNRPTPLDAHSPLRRQMIDSEHDDEIFEVEIAKRRAQVTNMNLGGSKIKQDDPARKNLENFFADPSNRKGNRSYPVNGPTGGGERQGRQHPGTTVLPSSDKPLILGPGGGPALTEEETGRAHLAESDQATGEQQLQDFFDHAIESNPDTLGPLLQPLLLRAKKEIEGLGEAGVRKAKHGVTHEGESGRRVAKINRIVTDFKAEVGDVLSKRAWEKTVTDINEYFAGKDNKPMAELALKRAKNDLGRATEIYAALYSALGFDEERIGRITSATGEDGLLDVHKVLPGPEWSGFVTAVTGDPELLAFAILHGNELAAVPNAGAVIRVWQANSEKVTKDDAVTILGLGFVADDAAAGAEAAKFVGTTAIPDLAALTELDGKITKLSTLRLYVACGGDVLSTKEIRALSDAPKLEDITTFYSRVAATRDDAKARWTLLKNTVAEDRMRVQIIITFVKAVNSGAADFNRLLNNWDDLNDREKVNSGTVASLVGKGVLRPQGKRYTSGTYGLGSIYIFMLAGQGRLVPEWHLHLKVSNKGTTVEGGGWKNKDEKFGLGVKTFDNSPTLRKAIEEAGKWV